MARDHLDILFDLTDQIVELDVRQAWINLARSAAETNQAVQLILDRKQTEVNRKRLLIEGMMADIRSQN
jgi:hypothetical protein